MAEMSGLKKIAMSHRNLGCHIQNHWDVISGTSFVSIASYFIWVQVYSVQEFWYHHFGHNMFGMGIFGTCYIRYKICFEQDVLGTRDFWCMYFVYYCQLLVQIVLVPQVFGTADFCSKIFCIYLGTI
jgi:hypothetical protein